MFCDRARSLVVKAMWTYVSDLGEEAGARGRCRHGVVLLSMAVVGSSFAGPRGLGLDLRGVLCHVAPSQHSEAACLSLAQQGHAEQRRDNNKVQNFHVHLAGPSRPRKQSTPVCPAQAQASGSQRRSRRHAWRRRRWRDCDSIPGDYHNPGTLATTGAGRVMALGREARRETGGARVISVM